MIVTEVQVEYSRTVNLGNYESERAQVGMTATVGDGETWMGVAHDLGTQVKDTVEVQLRESERARQEERRRLYHTQDTPDYAEGEDDDSDPETTRRMGDGH